MATTGSLTLRGKGMDCYACTLTTGNTIKRLPRVSTVYL